MGEPLTTGADKRSRKNKYALATAVVLAIIDLASKWVMAAVVMDPPQRITVLPFFDLVLVYNRGISFGLFGDLGSWGPVGVSVLTAAIIGLLIVWLFRTDRFIEAMGLGMVVGGGSGNLIDRLINGAVTDFLDFYIGVYHWPAFNGADIFITAGALCLLIAAFGATDKNSNLSSTKSGGTAS